MTRPIRFAETLKQRCSKIGHVDDIELYGVPLERINSGPVQRFAFGTKREKHKTMLLVGTSGSGKRTLINIMANYMIGVNMDDSFRFQLIDDEAAIQQKKDIIVYDIHQQADHFHYPLSIIDTPSYGEANNNVDSLTDREITELIHKCFADEIQDVNSIGFVINANQTKLTPSQEFIFDSLVTIFGAEVQQKMMFLLTFADDKDPPVRNAIMDGLHYTMEAWKYRSFKFNNAGILLSTTRRSSESTFGWSVEEEMEDLFNTLNGPSLSDLKRQKNEAERIKATEIGLESLIEAELNKIDTGEHNYQKHRLPIGQYAANCQKCRITCHHLCNCEEMSNCAVMDYSRLAQRTCHVCSCLSSEHSHQPYR